MPSHTVEANWVKDDVFLLWDRGRFPLVMTQPEGVNGADLLPLSLIGCAAWDIMDILRKQRQQVTGFRVTAESEQDADPPWRFRRIHIRYTIEGDQLNPQAVERAIALSETKYCSIFATLRSAVELVSEYELVDRNGREGG